MSKATNAAAAAEPERTSEDGAKRDVDNGRVMVTTTNVERSDGEDTDAAAAQPIAHLYSGFKDVWAVGKDFPVLGAFFGAAEAVASFAAGPILHKDLSDVDRDVARAAGNLDARLARMAAPGPPSLYQDVKGMLAVSTLAYPVNSLRIMARNSLTPKEAVDNLQAHNSGILDRPIKSTEIIEWMIKYGVLIGDPAFTSMLVGIIYKIYNDEYKAGLRDAEIVVISDAKNGEAVYLILLDKTNKRIIVSFRGTHDIQDTLQDIDILNATFPNPVDPSQELIFHKGFADYLFSKQFCSTGRKYDEIMGHVRTLLKQNEGFQLYVTGYSLGAALATIFAFYASCEVISPRPVVCMPVASPYVGDYTFLKAFQHQEQIGKIRMLRIANNKDLVTYVPNIIIHTGSDGMEALDGSAVPLKHVGMGLTMSLSNKLLGVAPVPFGLPLLTSEAASLEFSYPKEAKHDVDLIDPEKDLDDLVSMIFNHFGAEYLKRIEMNEGNFKYDALDDLYSDANLVGDSIPDFAIRKS